MSVTIDERLEQVWNIVVLGADGVLRWDPTALSDALAPVVLRVYDTRGSFVEQRFTIVVEGGNAAPSIAELPDGFELRAGELFQLGIDAVDADGQVVTVYIDNLPPGAIFDSRTRVLSWLPGHDQAGDYPDLRIVASDGITSTVKDLADQSNMLALNAAIEAVRSGEHGKGFALVARDLKPDIFVVTRQNQIANAAMGQMWTMDKANLKTAFEGDAGTGGGKEAEVAHSDR